VARPGAWLFYLDGKSELAAEDVSARKSIGELSRTHPRQSKAILGVRPTGSSAINIALDYDPIELDRIVIWILVGD
jgi:hypothetical protein